MKRIIRTVMMCCILSVCMMSFTACKSSDNTKTINSVDDIKGSRIGVQIGTTGDIYVSDYEGDKEGSTVERYNKGADAVQALKQGKIDCVVIDNQPAKAYVEDNPELKIINEEFTNENYAITISKKNKELTKKINSALEELKKNGILDKIKDTYISGKGDYHYTQKVTTGKTLVMATNAQFPPYEYYDDNKVTGMDIEMGYAIADILGMKLEIQDMDFDAIINAVQAGKADIGISGFTVTEERKKTIDFSESYTTSSQVVIVKDKSASGFFGKSLTTKLHDNFVKDSRWKYLAKGLGNTLVISIFAALLGILLGFIIAVIRVSYDKNHSLKILNAIAKLYLTVVRGTPVMVQLLIIYYVIFSSVNISKILVAIIAFGLNSAAYVAEIVRSGIMSIDDGQFEAGKSLGLKYRQIMIAIILPQAFKNILPALANEFIALLKETSISGYIGLIDLTHGGDIIRSITYEPFLPLISVALIYLVLVIGLSACVSKLERRLKKNER